MHRRSEIGHTTFAKRLLLPVVVGVALAIIAPAPTWAQTPSAADLTRLADECFVIVNQRRAEAGLAPYSRAPELDAAARRHSENMAATLNFSHTGTDGSTFDQRIKAAGYPGNPTGENIALGQDTAESVMQSWMNSTGHRANILSQTSNQIGIAVVFTNVRDPNGFYWTQVFGFREGAPAGGGGGTPGATGPTAAELEQKEVQLLDGINGDRSANGFDVLRRNAALDAAAKRHARDLAANNRNDHTGSDGSQPATRAADAGYNGTVLHSVRVGRDSAAQVLDDIWSTDNDFINLFSDTAKEIGVALAFNGQASNRYFWVVVYGTP